MALAREAFKKGLELSLAVPPATEESDSASVEYGSGDRQGAVNLTHA
jgi:hypothetical protein